jgi:antitoxin component YwqK of YwqJK toxin-antitoxin module
MKKNKLKEYKRYWHNGNLFIHQIDYKNDCSSLKTYSSNGKLKYVDYAINRIEEGEIIRYDY